MHGRDDFRAGSFDRPGYGMVRHDLAPGGLYDMDHRADALQYLLKQQTEPAEIDHQHPVTRRDQADQRRFDCGARGPVDQHRPAIGGAEHRAIQRHDLIHIGGHFGIELTQQIGRHGAKHARMGVDRAGPHQQPLRRIDLAEQAGVSLGQNALQGV